MNYTKWTKFLLKLSGEVFGNSTFGPLSSPHLDRIARDISDMARDGQKWAILTGGGNIQRGSVAAREGGNRILHDQIGMLATSINAIAFANALSKYGCSYQIYNSVGITGVVEQFSAAGAKRAWDDGRVLVFGGGIGLPYFSTDTAAALRALEIGADVFLKGTKVPGIFDRDPCNASDSEAAIFYPWISYDDLIARNLKVIDMTAIALCRENKLPVLVFNVMESGSLQKIFENRSYQTVVSERSIS